MKKTRTSMSTALHYIASGMASTNHLGSVPGRHYAKTTSGAGAGTNHLGS